MDDRRASRTDGRATLGALCLLLFVLALAAPAQAATTLTASQPDPVVGETVVVTADTTVRCPKDYTFTIDGVAQPASASETLTTSFSTTGTHTVEVEVVGNEDCGSDVETASLAFDVKPRLTGQIAVTPDPPERGRPATLSATQTGGRPAYFYAWDLDDDGAFDDATTRTVTITPASTGPRVVRVRIRDGATPTHETVTTRTLTVVEPATPPPDPTPTPTPTPTPGPGTSPTPTPTPGPGPSPEPTASPAPDPQPGPEPAPPCTNRLAFALTEVTTDGCFTRTGTDPSARWETTAAVRLNGIPFPDYGQTFVVTFPNAEDKGGRFTTTNAAIQIGGFTALAGDVDFSLPAGKQGEEKKVESIGVPSNAKLFGLRVLGSIDLRIGWADDGTYYATFPLNIELPSTFRAGPGRGAGTVTGAASLKVDQAGVRYDGLKIAAKDVWLGRIKVVETCFSFVPAGGQSVEPCETPSLDGEPYIACETDVGTDRWDGNAVIELPTASATRLAAFGGLADGSVSKLGGFVDNLGTTVPIVPGVFLNRVGVGLCLSPPPFKLRGDVGVALLPTPAGPTLGINGRFLYTDGTERLPWTLEVGGNVSTLGTQLGQGSVTFNAWGDVSFGLATELDLFGVASVTGAASGWVEPRNSTFNVSGSVEGCIKSVICARALGLISSTGVAGCIDAGELVFYEPYGAREGPAGFGSISFSTRRVVVPLKAGFGHRFGSGEVDLLGGSCDFAPYSATRDLPVEASQAGMTERVARGTKAVTLRVHGSNGPPKVVVRGPDGTTITPVGAEGAKQRKGRYMVAENDTDGTTSVLLVKPAAGSWTIAAAPGAASRPTRMDRSSYEAPAALLGRLRRTPNGRELAFGYAVPAGATVSLVERGAGIGRTIVRSVRGKPCRGARALPGGRKLLCARVRFQPSRGPGGARTVQAVVSRGGVPLERKNVVSFRAPNQILPTRPAAIRARRVKDAIIVTFPRARGASRYSVTAALSDGRKLAFDVPSRCRAVRIPDVARATRAAIEVAGVRYDLRTSRYRSVVLPGGRTSVGPGKLLVRLPCN